MAWKLATKVEALIRLMTFLKRKHSVSRNLFRFADRKPYFLMCIGISGVFFPPSRRRTWKKIELSNKTPISQSEFDVRSHVKTEVSHANILSNGNECAITQRRGRFTNTLEIFSFRKRSRCYVVDKIPLEWCKISQWCVVARGRFYAPILSPIRPRVYFFIETRTSLLDCSVHYMVYGSRKRYIAPVGRGEATA